jgi:hypothetical protein
VSSWWGLLWFGFGALSLGGRVYFGIHYRGDVVVGTLIGIAVTTAMNTKFVRLWIARQPFLEKKYPAVFYGVLFRLSVRGFDVILLYEIASSRFSSSSYRVLTTGPRQPISPTRRSSCG